jgi:hypothetical protein
VVVEEGRLQRGKGGVEDVVRLVITQERVRLLLRYLEKSKQLVSID